jgi:macrophage erythroblast attacher
MTNIDIFLVEKEIVESLMNKETAKCLAWCNENKSKLKKINVTTKTKNFRNLN